MHQFDAVTVTEPLPRKILQPYHCTSKHLLSESHMQIVMSFLDLSGRVKTQQAVWKFNFHRVFSQLKRSKFHLFQSLGVIPMKKIRQKLDSISSRICQANTH